LRSWPPATSQSKPQVEGYLNGVPVRLVPHEVVFEDIWGDDEVEVHAPPFGGLTGDAAGCLNSHHHRRLLHHKINGVRRIFASGFFFFCFLLAKCLWIFWMDVNDKGAGRAGDQS
jgi:hypothetical protein